MQTTIGLLRGNGPGKAGLAPSKSTGLGLRSFHKCQDANYLCQGESACFLSIFSSGSLCGSYF